MIDNDQVEHQKKVDFLNIFHSVEELRDWVVTYLDLDLPKGHVDPDSTSSPSEWLYEAYGAIRDNTGNKIPGYIVLSSRDSYKTITTSILEVLAIVHFQLTVSHMAAIKPQSAKAIQYINSFFRKIKPYMEYHKLKFKAENKANIQVEDKDGDIAYIVIIVCTLQGANSEHTNIMCVEGNELIQIENDKTTTNRKRRSIAAKTIYKRLQKNREVKVLTLNHLIGKLEFKKIIKGYKNNKKILEIILENNKSIKLTPEHRVYSIEKGYIESQSLEIGYSLLLLDKSSGFSNRFIKRTKKTVTKRIDDSEDNQFEQFMIGSLLGDGGCYRKSSNNAFYREQHCLAQKEYCQWKRSVLSNTVRCRQVTAFSGYTGEIQEAFSSGCSSVLNEWSNFKTTLHKTYKLGPLGLAIWYMDDGCKARALRFSSESFTYNQNILLKNVLKENFDINVEVKKYNKKDKTYFYLLGGTAELYKLYEICKKYIHFSMLYKFDALKTSIKQCKFCKKEFLAADAGSASRYCTDIICQSIRTNQLHPLKIKEIKVLNKTDVYDFTVEDNNNFFVNNILTHNCIDEIDVVQYPNAYEEAKLIPGVFNGRFPITIKTSTRKFAYGLMQQEIDKSDESGEKLLRWNIIDVTENCPKSRHKPEKKKQKRYIAKILPLKNLSKKEHSMLPEEDQRKYDSIWAYRGCAACPILQVCKMRLAERPEDDYAGLYKPIDATINLFRKTSPDMATAQLMCWKPSSAGLVYPRFDQGLDTGNVLSLAKAYKSISGEERANIDLPFLIEYLHTLGVKFYCGVDWGYRHYYAIIVGAILPNGEFWIVDSYAINELEYDDQLSLAMNIRDVYKPEKWYCDPAYPMMIKGFSSNGMKCPKFTKDVMGGIESTRAKIVDARDRRTLKVLKIDNNRFFLDMFKNHHFKMDAQGRITTVPDDEEYADIGDGLRYMCQELFPLKKNRKRDKSVVMGQDQNVGHILSGENWMKNEIKNCIKENGGNSNAVDMDKPKKRKGVLWIP